MDVKEQDRQYIMGTYKRQDLLIVRGKGAVCWDENGREYIDFGSGIGVNSLGYCNEAWTEAVSRQAAMLQHASNLYYTEPDVKLAKLLCESTGYRKALFCNSGAEANECAIKLARKYSFDKYGKDANRNKILCLKNSFHGRTVTTLSATGQDVFHNYYFPFTEGFEFAAANDLEGVKEKLDDGGFCAVMFEFIQGEGGVVPLTREFVSGLFELCAARDILTIADEVQTGIGRTGRLLASQCFPAASGGCVKPDLTTLAKGLGGGLPIGAVIAGEKACNVFGYSDHGTTFGGNPVVCAGAYAALTQISDENFLAEVRRKGDLLKGCLLRMDEVEAVDGLGMMLGVRLKTKKAADVAAACIQKGVIPLTAKEKIRLLPPLSITESELKRGIALLGEVLESNSAEKAGA